MNKEQLEERLFPAGKVWEKDEDTERYMDEVEDQEFKWGERD